MTTQKVAPRGRIAANVRAELARKRLTHEDLSEALQGSRSYWQRRTSGHTAFSVEELIAIASYLEVPLDAFLEGATDPLPNGQLSRVTQEYPRPSDYFGTVAVLDSTVDALGKRRRSTSGDALLLSHAA